MGDQLPEEQQIVVTGTPVEAANTKTVFGAINSPTPMWATWMFRIVFGLTTILAFWVGGSTLFEQTTKFEIIQGLKALDAVIFLFSKTFGIVLDPKPVLEQNG